VFFLSAVLDFTSLFGAPLFLEEKGLAPVPLKKPQVLQQTITTLEGLQTTTSD
jgi:hypothetical protein